MHAPKSKSTRLVQHSSLETSMPTPSVGACYSPHAIHQAHQNRLAAPVADLPHSKPLLFIDVPTLHHHAFPYIYVPRFSPISSSLAPMPPAKQHHRSARAFSKRTLFASPTMIHSDPNTSQVAPEKSPPDKTPARPAMPSGTVRARRVYSRYRKGKARLESQLEPATPNPPVIKQPDIATSQARPADSKKHPHNSTSRTQSEEPPSASVDQPVNSHQTHGQSAPQTSQSTQQTKHDPTPPQEDKPFLEKTTNPQNVYSQPQEMHPPQQHIPQQHPAPPASQFQHIAQPHIFPMHQHTGSHYGSHLMQVPASLQVTHLVPTQPPIYMPAQQQEVPFTQPHPIPVQAPRSSHDSACSPHPSQSASQQTTPALDAKHVVSINQTHATSYPAVASKNTVTSQQGSNSQKDYQAVSCHASVESPSPAKCDPSAPPQNTDADALEEDRMVQLVSRIKASLDGSRARPLICQDITNSNADMLRISRLPRGVTYDRLLSMVEPFGEVEDLAWSSSDPYVCDVTYRDAAAAHEAKHFLGDALVGSDSEPPLKAELRSRDPGAQLFVGDLTPDVTEEMLEAVFSELVGEPVSALLKRDPDSFSPIGYGFLSFKNESSANFALVAGHRIKVGNACVRVGRAERNTYLYVSDLSANVTMEELKQLFGKFGALVDEDTVIVRRSYAFVRYKNRGAAEKAKRTLDKTDLKGRLSVRYAEAEPLKACVAVQFHSSVPRPPNSLRDLLTATFSKHGNCSVEIPRLSNGTWRKVAFVTFHGEPVAANMAALEAVQSVRFVSSLPVCCQFARELIPRLPSRGLSFEKASGSSSQKENRTGPSDMITTRNFLARRNILRRNTNAVTDASKPTHGRSQVTANCRQQSSTEGVQQNGPDFVPVYVPLSALHHSGPVQSSGVPPSDCDFSRYHWQSRLLMPNNNAPPPNMNHSSHNAYNSFAGMQERAMRW